MMNGTIYSYTIVRSAAEEFKDQTPYIIAVIEQDSGSRVLSMLSGYKEGMQIRIGDQVKLDQQHNTYQLIS